ncbi:MAG: hypothetical protein IPL84_15445 [Chitinophagaceae bacterium]|nr:hypothetical protein [Chitinophagaceae bacterium]
MKKKDSNSEAAMLRKKAMEVMKQRQAKPALTISEVDMMILIHEQAVQQIDLELQNKELTLGYTIKAGAVYFIDGSKDFDKNSEIIRSF